MYSFYMQEPRYQAKSEPIQNGTKKRQYNSETTWDTFNA